MKTLIRSINRSPLRLALLVIPLVLACFGLVQNTHALLPPPAPDGGYAGGNTAEGDGALFNLTTGLNNTAVGKDALTSDTDGAYNVAIGRSALSANVSGNFNMAIGTEALRDSIATYNLAIGFRVGFVNTTAGTSPELALQRS